MDNKDKTVIRNTILRMKVDCIEYDVALDQLLNWTATSKSRYVCISNVHMCMEAFDSDEYKEIVNNSDLNLPDSAVIRFVQKTFTMCNIGKTKKGVDIVLDLCRLASTKGKPVGFYGSSQNTIEMLTEKVQKHYPELDIKFKYSPPFRSLTEAEDKRIVNDINSSGVKLLFVGLGCPKQERWMAEHKDKLNCVMIGVGAAFDFIAGTTKASPAWVHDYGFEWLYRLMSEPRRLWKRYLKQNPRFIWYFFLQLLGKKY